MQPNPLVLPADQGIRIVALKLLDDATRAGDKLREKSDEKSLHDFRVAIRRLRSWVRAFRKELKGSIHKKERQQLSEIADATNVGRDIDVQFAWLARKTRKRQSRKRKSAVVWLARQLTVRRKKAGHPIDAALFATFDDVRKHLADQLEKVEPSKLDPDHPDPTLAMAIADHLMSHLDAIVRSLTDIQDAKDVRGAHETRIAVKRLRYLLEPTAKRMKRAAAIVKQLKALQDELGALHDDHVMAHQWTDMLSTAPVALCDEIEAVTDAVSAEAARRFGRVSRKWCEDSEALPRLGRDVVALAIALRRLDA